jgi:hypothetical protein
MYALIVGLVGFLRVPEIRRFRLSVANFFGKVTPNMESIIVLLLPDVHGHVRRR